MRETLNLPKYKSSRGRSPGKENGNPLQYSCLENSMDRGAWWTVTHGVAESNMTEQLKLTSFMYMC